MRNPCIDIAKERVYYKLCNKRTGRLISVFSMEMEGELEFESVEDARNCFASGRFLDEDKYGVVEMTRYHLEGEE